MTDPPGRPGQPRNDVLEHHAVVLHLDDGLAREVVLVGQRVDHIKDRADCQPMCCRKRENVVSAETPELWDESLVQLVSMREPGLGGRETRIGEETFPSDRAEEAGGCLVGRG